jgi:hypothetical protein
MAAGDEFFTSGGTPRISLAEVAAIEMRGFAFLLQREHLSGASPGGPVIIYPLHRDEFKNAAREANDVRAQS